MGTPSGPCCDDDAELEKLAQQSADEVLSTQEPVMLQPMNSRERWVVHNTIASIDGVRSDSVGEGRVRRVRIEIE